MNRVKNKIAIITGGASGIGRATGILLAKEGAKVAIIDINQNEGEKLTNEINVNGNIARFWHVDIKNENAISNSFKEIEEKFGKINVLINNAGIMGTNKLTHEISEQEWDDLMAVNVKGAFLCTKHVIPYMLKQNRGSIINISSIYGIVGSADSPAYHASKGAVRLMSKTDAVIYAKYNIRVNSIHPGFIWTPLIQNAAIESKADIEVFKKKINRLHPLGHMGDPEDVAYAILYLASDESKFMTGSELIIDGGYTAR